MPTGAKEEFASRVEVMSLAASVLAPLLPREILQSDVSLFA